MGPRRPTNRRVGWALVSAALTTLGTVGCENPTTPIPAFATSTLAITDIRGTGSIGDGAPLGDGVNRQVFDFAVSVSAGVVSGRLDYTDYTVLKPDGRYAHFVVGTQYPGTAVLTFVPTSSACVEFDGSGLVINTGELLAFRVQVCDNGSPGTGRDIFFIAVPERFVTHGQGYQRGPDMLSSGEITASGPGLPGLSLAP